MVCQRRQQKTAVTIRLETHSLDQNERSRLLPPGQRRYVHLLSLSQLALVTIQVPEIVDGAEGRGVVRS
jgi:hypothetical protein